MRAAGGQLGFAQFAEQPGHAFGVERHVDLDGGVAGDGGGDARARGPEVLALIETVDLLQHFDQHAFELAAFEADGRGLNGEGARAEGLDFEAVAFELRSDLGEGDHLGGREVDEQWHEQTLALHALDFALAQNFFEEHALVRDVLVDDPEAFLVGGEDEGLAELADGLERGECVECGGLIGDGSGCGLR